MLVGPGLCDVGMAEWLVSVGLGGEGWDLPPPLAPWAKVTPIMAATITAAAEIRETSMRWLR